jgi:hypothetical protein
MQPQGAVMHGNLNIPPYAPYYLPNPSILNPSNFTMATATAPNANMSPAYPSTMPLQGAPMQGNVYNLPYSSYNFRNPSIFDDNGSTMATTTAPNANMSPAYPSAMQPPGGHADLEEFPNSVEKLENQDTAFELSNLSENQFNFFDEDDFFNPDNLNNFT